MNYDIKVISFMLLFFGFYTCSAQKILYEIKHLNTKLGDLTVTQSQNENETIIDVNSSVRFKLIVHIDLKYHLKSVYDKGTLISSEITTHVNHKLHSSMLINKVGDTYHINNNGKTTFYFDLIDYSGAMLYFNEPVGILKMFSEIDGHVVQVKKEGNHQYKIIHSDKKDGNEFFYENGILKKTIIQHPLLSFTVTKI